MSEPIKIVLESRSESGSSACGRLRRAGYLPAVVYGPGMEKGPLSVKLETKAVAAYLSDPDYKSLRFQATFPCGAVKDCVIKSATKDFYRDQLLHLDLYCLA